MLCRESCRNSIVIYISKSFDVPSIGRSSIEAPNSMSFFLFPLYIEVICIKILEIWLIGEMCEARHIIV